jgi:hypothetical protein
LPSACLAPSVFGEPVVQLILDDVEHRGMGTDERAGAHPGLIAPFTLLEFEAGLPDILFLNADQPDSTMVVGGDPRVAKHAENFEELIESALSAKESIDLMRSIATEMS